MEKKISGIYNFVECSLMYAAGQSLGYVHAFMFTEYKAVSATMESDYQAQKIPNSGFTPYITAVKTLLRAKSPSSFFKLLSAKIQRYL